MTHHAEGRTAHTNLHMTPVKRSRNLVPAMYRALNPMGN